jgi:sortase A
MATATRRRGPVRATLRFVASVMMLSGVLLLADAGLTLAWQEPISAYMAGKQQSTLKKKFRNPPPRVLNRKPLKGDAIARIELPTIHKHAYVVEGTDTGTLRKGPGHYPETPLPGDGGTSGIAGHRTTYGAPFRRLDDVKRGDPITVYMPDGTFRYRVEENKIVDNDDVSVKKSVGYDRLLLSACHPLHSAAQRVIVFAKLVRRGKAKVR